MIYRNSNIAIYKQLFLKRPANNRNLKNLPRIPSVTKSLRNSSQINNSVHVNDSKLTRSLAKICHRKGYQVLSNSLSRSTQDENQYEKLKDKYLKTKSLYNEQALRLKELKLAFNKLYDINISNNKILMTIFEKAGLGSVKFENFNEVFDMISACDFSGIKDLQEYKDRHLINCYRARIIEYKYLLNQKISEINYMTEKSRIAKLAKLEGECANQNIENWSLNKDRTVLMNQVQSMEDTIKKLREQISYREAEDERSQMVINSLDEKLKFTLNVLNNSKDISSNFIKERYLNVQNESSDGKVKDQDDLKVSVEIDKINGANMQQLKDSFNKREQKLKNQIKLLKWENDKLNRSLQKINKEHDEYSIRLLKLEDERNKYLSSQRKPPVLLRDKEKEIRNLKEQVSDLNSKYNVLFKQNECLKGENSDLKTTIDNIQTGKNSDKFTAPFSNTNLSSNLILSPKK